MLILSPLSILADQIVLKNGDKLTGKIIKKDGDSIVIQTEFAGTVTIKWDAVERIIAEEPVNLELTDGQKIKGTVVTKEEENLEIATKDAGTVEVKKESVEVVRNDAEQLRFEEERDRLLNPGVTDLWTGTADLGLSFTSGNSKTRAFTAGARAARETTRDKISVYANVIKASNSTTGPSVTTADALWAGARYDLNLSEKTFVFGTADFETDQLQQLDLRAVFGGGLGYRAIRSERTQLDLFAGATVNNEYFDDDTSRRSGEILFGDELKYKLTSSTNLEQRLVVYPNITRAGTFRSIFDTSLITSLNDWLGWQVTVGNRFNSDPLEGAVKNDFIFTTGLRATFGRKN